MPVLISCLLVVIGRGLVHVAHVLSYQRFWSSITLSQLHCVRLLANITFHSNLPYQQQQQQPGSPFMGGGPGGFQGGNPGNASGFSGTSTPYSGVMSPGAGRPGSNGMGGNGPAGSFDNSPFSHQLP